MADTLVVYFSLEGNVDFVARELAREFGADLFRLQTVKEYPKKGLMKFVHGGRDTIKGFKPELKALPDLSAYKTILVGAPVWASKPAAPLNTFFEAADFSGKSVSLFASSAGGNSKKCLAIMREITGEKGGTVKEEEEFTNPLKDPEKTIAQVKAFVERIKC
jgi:flavodoxin